METISELKIPAEAAESILNHAAKVFASRGGKAGTGAAKRRSKAHYRRMVEARIAANKKKKAEKS